MINKVSIIAFFYYHEFLQSNLTLNSILYLFHSNEFMLALLRDFCFFLIKKLVLNKNKCFKVFYLSRHKLITRSIMDIIC